MNKFFFWIADAVAAVLGALCLLPVPGAVLNDTETEGNFVCTFNIFVSRDHVSPSQRF